MISTHSAVVHDVPALPELSGRIAALAGHPLEALLRDQLRIIGRIDEDQAGTFAPGDPLEKFNQELTGWEKPHLLRCLKEWLDVIEQNQRWDAAGPKVLNVRDYGAKGDGVADDRDALLRACQAASAIGEGTVVKIPAGRYLMKSLCDTVLEAHLVLEGLADIVIAGEGNVELLGSAEATILRLQDCRNIRLRGFALDFDPVIFTQGRIESISEDRSQLVWEADAGFPQFDQAPLVGMKKLAGLVLDEQDHFLPHPHDMFTAVGWERIDACRWRLRAPAGAALRGDVKPGMRMVITKRKGPWHGMVITRSEWVDAEEVHVWGAYQFASYAESSKGVSYRRSHIEPKPNSGRFGGLNADGYHARSSRFGPFYEDCRILRVADDCFNLNTRMASVLDTPSERQIVLDASWLLEERIFHCAPVRCDMVVGDMLVFISPCTGELAGWGVIQEVQPRTWHGTQQIMVTLDRAIPGLISRQQLGLHTRVQSSSEFLADDHSPKMEHFAINVSTKCDGFVIRGCKLGDNTVTGGKIKAGNGLIVNNHTFRHGWCVWSLATETNWQEGYAPRRILIENNRFESWFGIFMGSGYPLGRKNLGTPLGYRIDVINNIFSGVIGREYCLDINAVHGCVVRGNELSPDRPVVVGPTARAVELTDNR